MPTRETAERPLLTLAVLSAAALWMVQLTCGFRMPWSPIVVTDGDAGAAVRQAVFSIAGLAALAWLGLHARLALLLRGRTAIVLLTALIVASSLTSSAPTLTAKRSAIFVFGVVLQIALCEVTPRPGSLLVRAIVIAASLSAWVSLAAWALLPTPCWSIGERPGLCGITGHPNQLAPIMVFGLTVSIASRPTGGGRPLLWLNRGAMLTALILSESVTSFLFLAVALAVTVLLDVAPYRRGALALAGIALAAALLAFGASEVRDAALLSAGKDASLSGRTELWDSVLREGLKQPILGWGFGAFWTEGKGRLLTGTWNPRQSHQAYMDVFLDLGAVGVVLTVAAYGGALFLGWHRHGRGARRETAALVAVGVAALAFYALGESFLLKMDKFGFFVLSWIAIVLTHRAEPGSLFLQAPVERGERNPEQASGFSRGTGGLGHRPIDRPALELR